MTRDEAIKTVETEMALTTNAAAQLVCGLVALGVLKLDEPKIAETRLYEELGRLPIPDDLRRAPKGESSLVDRVARAIQREGLHSIIGNFTIEDARHLSRAAIEVIDAEEIEVGCSACGWGGKMEKRELRHKQCPSCAIAWIFH